jgi:hypothetical protein
LITFIYDISTSGGLDRFLGALNRLSSGVKSSLRYSFSEKLSYPQKP